MWTLFCDRYFLLFPLAATTQLVDVCDAHSVVRTYSAVLLSAFELACMELYEPSCIHSSCIKNIVACVHMFQLTQAQTGKFNVHVHVEYEWRLQNEDLDESEDEMEDKVSWFYTKQHIDMVVRVVRVCNSVLPAAHP